MTINFTEKELNDKFKKIKSLIEFTEKWCKYQSNGMTDGQICISAMKDLRRIIKEKH